MRYYTTKWCISLTVFYSTSGLWKSWQIKEKEERTTQQNITGKQRRWAAVVSVYSLDLNVIIARVHVWVMFLARSYNIEQQLRKLKSSNYAACFCPAGAANQETAVYAQVQKKKDVPKGSLRVKIVVDCIFRLFTFC